MNFESRKAPRRGLPSKISSELLADGPPVYRGCGTPQAYERLRKRLGVPPEEFETSDFYPDFHEE